MSITEKHSFEFDLSAKMIFNQELPATLTATPQNKPSEKISDPKQLHTLTMHKNLYSSIILSSVIGLITIKLKAHKDLIALLWLHWAYNTHPLKQRKMRAYTNATYSYNSFAYWDTLKVFRPLA